jgi:hypothetical protein
MSYSACQMEPYAPTDLEPLPSASLACVDAETPELAEAGNDAKAAGPARSGSGRDVPKSSGSSDKMRGE